MRKLGNFKLHSVLEGMFRLDGGAMFGSVPKVLWEKLNPADDKNRIDLALRCLLVQSGKRNIIIDTGIGEKWEAKFIDMFAIDHATHDMRRALASLGLKTTDITDVILTHFHFDHAGGVTHRNENGELKLTFPNAVHYVQKKNADIGQNPNLKDKASYLPENIDLVLQQKNTVILDGDVEILPGISAIVSDGHTTGMQLVKVSSGGETVVYCADLIPTASHIPLAFVMGYDLYAATTMEEKESLLNKAADENWILFFEHDPKIPACRVQRNKNNFKAGETVAI